MYTCEKGHLFDDPVLIPGDKYEAWGAQFYDHIAVCPVCHGEVEKVEQCDHCGEYVPATEIEEGYCKACVLQVQKKLDAFLVTLTEQEKALLNTMYYGVDVFI